MKAIMDRLLRPILSTEPCSLISVAQLMKDLLPDVSPACYRLCILGGWWQVHPANIEGSFGSTFCEVPDAHTITATSRTREPHEPDTTRNSSSFFDVTAVNDDDEAAADEALLATSLLSGINEPIEQPHSFRSTGRGPSTRVTAPVTGLRELVVTPGVCVSHNGYAVLGELTDSES
ncbi:hypothetical protein GQ600_9451 [Phytophthora cactorum]|nr:hypothetical protein GQ600_9451 [Phytophthora cactorum]